MSGSEPVSETLKAISSFRRNVIGFLNRRTFSNLALVTMASSALGGWVLMSIVDKKREMIHQEKMNLNKSEQPQEENKNKISQQESMLRAMIENATTASFEENLSNAAMAQKNFMLVQFDKSVEKEKKDVAFMTRIVKRSEQIRERSSNNSDVSKRIDRKNTSWTNYSEPE